MHLHVVRLGSDFCSLRVKDDYSGVQVSEIFTHGHSSPPHPPPPVGVEKKKTKCFRLCVRCYVAVVILEQVRKYLEVVKPVPTQNELEKSWYRTERGPSDKVLGVLVTDWFQRIKTSFFFPFVSF